MSEQERIAGALRDLADRIEAGDIEVTGTRFDRPTLSGEGQEWTIKFNDHAVMDWNQEFWNRVRD